ncbi:hypothetical protein Agabi119p4_8079 [Agaricus bisporus var. burnettii]|uniref:RNA helicase n=1 Tax=Agaricus bisporus var. burnettii TaxID=192524 RepID=A0A8H7EY10_AGABI|nr:hypothetical protein Agabi119p4_8079 [Agaricus bisporus var. burnettii]
MGPLERHKSLKRKKNTGLGPRKKSKIQRSVDELPWKTSRRPLETGLGGDDGILEFEEVEGVEVVYEMTEGGRVAKFQVHEPDQPVREENSEIDVEDGVQEVSSPEILPFDSTLLPEWASYSLHPQLLHALYRKGFKSPTSIQAAAIPVAVKGKDVVGVAQTGSGKTLAYGIPILHYLLSQPRPHPNKRRPVKALILAPTRELALQVSSHLNECLNPTDPDTPATRNENSPDEAQGKDEPAGNQKGKRKKAVHNLPVKKRPPHVSVAAIVGGMSAQKQRRIIDRGVDVLVGTPGRLWDIIGEDDSLAKELKNLRFLVLDEADRMIESGHFAELENILRLTLREDRDDEIPVEYNAMDTNTNEEQKPNTVYDLQTFVLSATLSKDLQRNLKKRWRPKNYKKRKGKNDKPATTLDDLLLRLDFRDPEPEIIDLSPEGKVVSTLQEAKIECLVNEKDTYLYYFLLRHPGRSLVFLSSIDGVRRLMPLLGLLSIKVFPLHSQLEQRQRLKNLDRFKSTPNSVLLATDIAARGLDIPAVDHVVHFQIPRTADSYIHRSGRTARAMNKGFSMLVIGPDERRVVKALMGSLSRDERDIPELSVDLNMLDKLKERVQLARQIEQRQHQVQKNNYEKNWVKETAEALGVDLDSDYVSESDDDKSTNRQRKTQESKTFALKAQLKAMLAQPLVARGISTRYITSGSRPIVDDLLSGETHEVLLGLKKAEAGSELVLKKRKTKTKASRDGVNIKEEDEAQSQNDIEDNEVTSS